MNQTDSGRDLRGLRFCLVLVLALLLSGCAKPDGHMVVADGTVRDFNFAQWQGQWLLINYWAQWCAPCRVEIPELNHLNERADLQVLGVNFDGIEGDKLNEVVAEMSVAFPTVLGDPGMAFGVERPTVLPITLVIDPAGQLQHVLRGPQTQATIEAAMTAPAPAPAPVAEG